MYTHEFGETCRFECMSLSTVVVCIGIFNLRIIKFASVVRNEIYILTVLILFNDGPRQIAAETKRIAAKKIRVFWSSQRSSCHRVESHLFNQKCQLRAKQAANKCETEG